MKRRWMWVVAGGVAAMVVFLGWQGPYFGRRHLTAPASSGIPYAEGTVGREQPDATERIYIRADRIRF